jgi:anti-sigma B factor antagonist
MLGRRPKAERQHLHRIRDTSKTSTKRYTINHPEINLFLTFTMSFADNISRMSEQPLRIEDLPGAPEGVRILRLSGPLTLQNLFGFQSQVRADNSRALILDFTDVPLADSAGIGALVGAYVNRQKDGRSLGLVGVNRRIHQALESTRVESFFRFFGTVAEAEQAA